MIASLGSDLENALTVVGATMRSVSDPWWIIGSAAVVLHGVVTHVADVDLLVSERDAATLATRLGLRPEAPDAHPKFRSSAVLHWRCVDYTIEIMAGLTIADETGWSAIKPTSRQSVDFAGERVFFPDRAELMMILSRFGRPKDLDRMQMLAALG